jgi:protein O-GlcNAc transferase
LCRYVSSDFGNHPLSHLMGSVFGMHHRDHVEVFCYALSQSDGSEWRQRISAEAEHFVDVSTMSSDAIAHLICDDQIQILVNLNGYTKVILSSAVPFFVHFMLNPFHEFLTLWCTLISL